MLCTSLRSFRAALALSFATSLAATVLAPCAARADELRRPEFGAQVGVSGGLFTGRSNGGLLGVDLTFRNRLFIVGGFYESEQGHPGAGHVSGAMAGVSFAPSAHARVELFGLVGARNDAAVFLGLRACASFRAGSALHAVGGFCLFARQAVTDAEPAGNATSQTGDLHLGVTMRVGAGFDL